MYAAASIYSVCEGIGEAGIKFSDCRRVGLAGNAILTRLRR